MTRADPYTPDDNSEAETALELAWLEGGGMNVKQIYAEWMWQYRNLYHKYNSHPVTVTEKTAKALRIDEARVERVVKVMSRRQAALTLRKTGAK